MPSALSLDAIRRHPWSRHPWSRRALWALGALLLLWLLAWLAVPPLAKGPLERLASEKLGRAVTVGQMDFKPWSLEITLRDIAVAGLAGAPPQLQVARVHVDAELQSIFRLAPVVDALDIDAPHLRLALLSDGQYDVDDILARFASDPGAPASEPARIALYNLALRDGQIDFTDKPLNKEHSVRQVALSLPFVSTLPSQREVKVAPHLAFEIGGSHFDSSAEGTPFAQTSQGQASIKLDGLDLAPYLAYLPANLPVKLQAATLDLDMKLAFEQAPKVAVKLSGLVQTRGVRVADRDGQDLLTYQRLALQLADVRPLEHLVHLAKFELDAPVFSAARNAQGRINVVDLLAPRPRINIPVKHPLPKPDPGPVWRVAVDEVAMQGGVLHWSDASTRPAAALQASELSLGASGIAYPFEKPFTLHGGLQLQGATVAFKGEASDHAAQVQVSLQGLGLPLAAPYLAQWLTPRIDGLLSGDIGLQWQAPSEPQLNTGATGVQLRAGPLALEKFSVVQGKTTLAAMERLALEGVSVDLDARSAKVERLAITAPKAEIERGRDGRWMFEQWLRPMPADATTPTPASDKNTAPWQVQLAQAQIEGGSATLRDLAAARPVVLRLSKLNVTSNAFASNGSRPQPLTASVQIAADSGPAGQLSYRGTLTPEPLAAQGRLEATRIPLHALDGYLADQLAIELLHADLGVRGDLAFAQSTRGTTLGLAADVALDELRANSTAASTPKTADQVGAELLSWKSLSLRGLNIALAPETAPKIAVKETSLADFFARITINENGRINLAELTQPKASEAGAGAPAGAASAPASAPVPAPPSSAASAAVAAAPAADPLAPQVQFGPVSLVNGKVLFSDFFIRPNYSADLSELTGSLSAFSSQPAGGDPVLADLQLRGRAEGSATLEITGKLNPLAQPLALDIRGQVHDLELPPLSPYSVKYAGHGIERGKLSMDVNYKVLPSGALTANNKLVLNQLTFGEPVAGAPNSLPVKLAVALLADRQGVIDLDLPISGSLNDPQFRLGPIIFKVIVNLIGKAITAPFALLASALGGGDQLSHVAFAPGSAELTTQAKQGLDKVAKALLDRPALRMTVTGTASLAREREGMQRERLAQLLLAEKRRTAPQDTRPVQAAEIPALTKAVYGRTDMPKPRNLIGIAKDLPQAEMEALLLGHLSPPGDDMALALATQRGQAVKAYLAAQKLPESRLFLAAPKTTTPEGTWTPQAQLSLAAQ